MYWAFIAICNVWLTVHWARTVLDWSIITWWCTRFRSVCFNIMVTFNSFFLYWMYFFQYAVCTLGRCCLHVLHHRRYNNYIVCGNIQVKSFGKLSEIIGYVWWFWHWLMYDCGVPRKIYYFREWILPHLIVWPHLM